MSKHITNFHAKAHQTKGFKRWSGLSEVKTQWAFRNTETKKNLYRVRIATTPIPLPSSTTDGLGSFPLMQTSSQVIPSFYQELYWTEWINEIKGHGPWASGLKKAVFSLVELPSTATIKKATGNPEKAKLEAGLLRVHQILEGYLSKADAWLSSYHHSVRNNLKGR